MSPAPALQPPTDGTPAPSPRAAGVHLPPAPCPALSIVAVKHSTALNRKVKIMNHNTNQHRDIASVADHSRKPIEVEASSLDHPDRGDVPGWVMLTLMSAVLVAGLLLIAQPALEGLFNDAISRVSGQ